VSIKGTQLEVDKRVVVGVRKVGKALAVLVAGATRAKWPEAGPEAASMVASFKASLAPPAP